MPENLRVLIVDDSEDDARLLLRELRRGGYEPMSKRVDTREAMAAALEAQGWDVVIADYVMPGFGGQAALKLYQDKGLDFPFIVVSGKVGEETAVEMLKAGAHDYVMKDNLKRLVPAVRRELQAAAARSERRASEQKTRKLYALISAVRKANQLLLRVKSSSELFRQICNALMSVRDFKFVWMGVLEDQTRSVKPVAWAGAEQGLLSAIRISVDDSPQGRGPTGTALRTRTVFVSNDVESLDCPSGHKNELLKRGFLSVAAVPIIAEGKAVGGIQVYTAHKGAFGDDEVQLLEEVAGDVAVGLITLKLQEEVHSRLNDLQKVFGQTVQAISTLCEMKDPYTAGHERRVAQLSYAIGTQMKLPASKIEGLHVAAHLHDAGKVAVPTEILSKPGKLNQYEFGLIKAHTQVGYEVLRTIEFPWPVAETALQHHERLDGSGYPAGLVGDQIILEARIVGVSDVVEAMASHRPYRPAVGVDKALLEILKGKGTLYDPAVVDACVTAFSERRFQFD